MSKKLKNPIDSITNIPVSVEDYFYLNFEKIKRFVYSGRYIRSSDFIGDLSDELEIDREFLFILMNESGLLDEIKLTLPAMRVGRVTVSKAGKEIFTAEEVLLGDLDEIRAFGDMINVLTEEKTEDDETTVRTIKKPRRKYSINELETIVNMYESNFSYDEIAKNLGLSYNNIQTALKISGIIRTRGRTT